MNTEAKRCQHHIEKEIPGKMYVAWRRQCKNKTKNGDYCWQHKSRHQRFRPLPKTP